MSVERVGEAVGHSSEFHLGDVAEAEHFAVGVGADNYVLEFLRLAQTAFVAQSVLERLVALFAEGTGSGLDVLFGKGGGNIGRHEIVLSHHIRFEPDTHRIVGAERHDVAHTAYTLELRDDVDFHVVVEELTVVAAVGAVERHAQKHRGLAFLCVHAHLIDLGWKEVGGLGDTVLDIDGGHVRVEALFEVNVYCSRTVVGGGRLHIGHAFGTVDRLFEWCDHRIEHGLGVGAGIGCRYRDCRRCDVRELGYWQ